MGAVTAVRKGSESRSTWARCKVATDLLDISSGWRIIHASDHGVQARVLVVRPSPKPVSEHSGGRLARADRVRGIPVILDNGDSIGVAM